MDRSSGAGSPRDPGARIPAAGLLAVAVVILAGALRLWSLNRAPSNPFYDAAVRSMGLWCTTSSSARSTPARP